MPLYDNEVPIIKIFDNGIECLTVYDNDVLVHARRTTFFNLNYDNLPIYDSQLKTWGLEQVTKPVDPVRADYIFKGWFTKENDGEKIIFPYLSQATDVILYAQWEENLPIQTVEPIIGTPICYGERSVNSSDIINYLKVSCKNSDPNTVNIRLNDVIVLTLGPNQETMLIVDSGFEIKNIRDPYRYSFKITAQANGKLVSNGVSKTGNIIFCDLQ